MEARLKRNKGNIEINVFSSMKDHSYNKSLYNNILTKDPNIIAQILIDLMILGFPIQKSVKIFSSKVKKHDWMGV